MYEDKRLADLPPFVKVLSYEAGIYDIGGHIVCNFPSKHEIQTYCPHCHHDGVADGPHHFEGYTFTRCSYCGRKLDERVTSHDS